MSESQWTRRQFVAATSLGSLAAVAAQTAPARAAAGRSGEQAGDSGRHAGADEGVPRWPIWDKEHDEELVLSVLRSGVWSRGEGGGRVRDGSTPSCSGPKRCVATTHGTTALLTRLCTRSTSAWATRC